MNEERRRILDMLAQGKITVDEADKLLAAVGGTRTLIRHGRMEP